MKNKHMKPLLSKKEIHTAYLNRKEKTTGGISLLDILEQHNDRVDNKRNNPTKTFIGGVVCTLIVIYGIFPLADYVTDTLLNYLMK